MNKSCFTLLAAIVLGHGSSAVAQQEVRLKTGATLIGTAKFEGDDAVVRVGDSTLRFPRDEVSLITALTTAQAQLPEPRRLLNIALEAKLLSGAKKEVVGLLAEASRLAPDDAQIAFWYATSLLDAGYGKAAQQALAPRRDEIARLYPGVTDQLDARIQERLKLEALPPQLLAKIDEVNAAGEAPTDSNQRRYSAVFRVVDQHQSPVGQNAIRVQCNGNDEALEAFPLGYYLFTFNRSRGNSNDPCQIDVNDIGLRPAEFPLPVVSGPLSAPLEFVAHRFDKSERISIRVRVTDRDDKPVADAKLALRPTSRRGNVSEESLSAVSNDEGNASFDAFPLTYNLDVNAPQFKSETQSVELRESSKKGRELHVKLYALLTGEIRVNWRFTPSAPNGETITGETTLPIGVRALPPYNDGHAIMQTLRPLQVEDRMMIQFSLHHYGGYPMALGGQNAWVRAVEVKSPEGEPDVLEDLESKFAEIDLGQLDKYKEESKAIELGGAPMPNRSPGLLPIDARTIYFGKLPHRDMRSSQMGELAFKLIISELATDPKPSE